MCWLILSFYFDVLQLKRSRIRFISKNIFAITNLLFMWMHQEILIKVDKIDILNCLVFEIDSINNKHMLVSLAFCPLKSSFLLFLNKEIRFPNTEIIKSTSQQHDLDIIEIAIVLEIKFQSHYIFPNEL